MHLPVRACALLCALVTVAAQGDDRDALVEALYRESGLAEQVVGIPQQIIDGFSAGLPAEAGEPGLPSEAAVLLDEEVRRAFAADNCLLGFG